MWRSSSMRTSVWSVDGHVEVCFLWRHFCQCTSSLIHVVNYNDRNKVVDALGELSKSVKDGMLDMVVLAVANTFTSSTVTRPSKECWILVLVAHAETHLLFSTTSDDPALASLTVVQPLRVAQPQDASTAPHLRSLLSSSGRSYLDAYTSSCF